MQAVSLAASPSASGCLHGDAPASIKNQIRGYQTTAGAEAPADRSSKAWTAYFFALVAGAAGLAGAEAAAGAAAGAGSACGGDTALPFAFISAK